MTPNEAISTLDYFVKRHLLGVLQRNTLREFILQSEESAFFCAKVEEMSNIIALTPRMGQQEGDGDKAFVYLHYFLGNYDCWITELNRGTGEAFGKASFEGASEAEYGYISLQELFDNNVELDLYWTPKPIGEIK